MHINKTKYNNWDHSSACTKRVIMADILADHIILRPGVVVMLLEIIAAWLISSEILMIVSIAVILIVASLMFFLGKISNIRVNSRIALFYFLLLPLILLFFYHGRCEDSFDRKYWASMYGRVIELEGMVSSVPVLRNSPDEMISVEITLDNGCRIWLSGICTDLCYGDFIRTVAEVYKPAARSNPGGFSQIDYLSDRGIYAAGRIAGKQSIEIIKQGSIGKRTIAAAGLRADMQGIIRMILPEKAANTLLAVFLGDDRNLDTAAKISFRRCGIAHLTSVSGAHMSFLLIPLSLITGLFRLGRRGTAGIQIIILAVYGTLTGWNTGALRAFIMLAIMLGLKAFDRQYDAVNSLGLACTLMMLIDPYVVKQLGFWLSLGATIILTIAVIPLSERVKTIVLEKTGKMLPDSIVYSLCTVLLLQLLLMPLSARITGEIFWLSWLFNIPSIFIVSIICTFAVFILPIMLILTHIGGLITPLTNSVRTAAELILGLPLFLLRKIAETGAGNQARTAEADISTLIYMGVFLLVLAFWFRFIQPRRFFFGKIRMKAGILVMTAGLIISFAKINMAPVWSLYFLDVGQGDSLLIVNRKSELAILVDGGPQGSGFFDIEPAMACMGISKIDLAIVTHGHADHAAGIMELIEIGLVKEVVLPEIIELLYREGFKNTVTAKEQHYVENDMSKALIDCCIDNSIPVQFWKKHDTISLPDEASLSVLAPDNSIGLDRVEDDPNDASLIMFFKWQQIDVLLLADLTKQQELDLMSVWDKSEIIKVAHHGSRFTTGNQFLEKVQPEHAIISSGPNMHGHPAPEVIERLLLSDCRVWRTDEGGCVIVNIGQGNKSIRYY